MLKKNEILVNKYNTNICYSLKPLDDLLCHEIIRFCYTSAPKLCVYAYLKKKIWFSKEPGTTKFLATLFVILFTLLKLFFFVFLLKYRYTMMYNIKRECVDRQQYTAWRVYIIRV